MTVYILFSLVLTILAAGSYFKGENENFKIAGILCGVFAICSWLWTAFVFYLSRHGL